MPLIKKIVIIGPESTGKSTLTQGLAKAFGEPYVEEYARQYLENLHRDYVYEDLKKIAEGQLALEDQKATHAKRLLFCDTDLHVVRVWSEHKYKKTDPWVLEQIKTRKYDLYLLTDIDMDWQEDPLREHPEPHMRAYFFNVYHQLLMNGHTPFYRISGGPEKRLDTAIRIIRQFGE